MNRIKERREALGLTAEELSRRSYVTRSYISKLEKDLHSCSVATGILLAKALDTTLDGLFWPGEEGGTPCQK